MMLMLKKKLLEHEGYLWLQWQQPPLDVFFLENLPHDYYLVGFSSMTFSLDFSEIERTESASHSWDSPREADKGAAIH